MRVLMRYSFGTTDTISCCVVLLIRKFHISMSINFEDLLMYERKVRNLPLYQYEIIPRFIFQSFRYIIEHPMEGEFRISPREDVLKLYKAKLLAAPHVGVPLEDTFMASTLLKFFLRSCSPMLLTREQADAIIQAQGNVKKLAETLRFNDK